MTPSALPFDGRKLQVKCSASNGYVPNWVPLEIKINLTIVETDSGATVTLGGGHGDYPSFEVWQYGGASGQPTLLYYQQEGEFSDLITIPLPVNPIQPLPFPIFPWP